jgi:hypothetical protein
MTTIFIANSDKPIEDGDRHWQQIPEPLKDEYIEIGMREGSDVEDHSQPHDSSATHICVLEEDVDENLYPSPRNAPGY